MQDHDKIYQELGNVRGSLDVGFKGVHKRLDTLNGTVAKHEKRLQEAEKEIANNGRVVNKSTDFKEKWTDRILNALFTGALVVVVWLLFATGILNPPL